MTIDHVTIRTNDLESTKAFFITVFDLVEKPRPQVIERIPGYWLFYNNEPIVHLIGSIGDAKNYSSNAIDHIGFKYKNYSAFKEKLKKLSIPFSLMDIEELDERRIFLNTPENVLLEVVFEEKIN